MSSTTSTPITSSSTPSPTQNRGGGGGSNPGSFYKNLFYILIGLLCAFGLVSFLSLMRARRRRLAIVREAERLGVIVPGVPGYIPLRDRRNLNWLKSDGTSHPDWWEIEKVDREDKKPEETRGSPDIIGNGVGSGVRRRGDIDEFYPLSLIPPAPPPLQTQPVPQSALPYFPNHLAYRPESLLPPPSKFHPHDSSTSNSNIDPNVLNELVGEKIEVITIIKMPIPPEQLPKPRPPNDGDGDDDEEDSEGVMREWLGIELGITDFKVGNGYRDWRD